MMSGAARSGDRPLGGRSQSEIDYATYTRWLQNASAETIRLDARLRPAGVAGRLYTVLQHLIVAHQRLCFAKGLHERLGCDSWVCELALDVANVVFEQNAALIHSTFMGTHTVSAGACSYQHIPSPNTTLDCAAGEIWHVYLPTNIEDLGARKTGLGFEIRKEGALSQSTRPHCVIS